MTRSITREQLAESCDQLAAALAAPRSLEIDDAHRVAIEQALARVRAQLLGGDEAALVVALVGGTGVGKSTLINALAGSTIAEATGRRRPVTSRITVYHHRDLPAGNLPVELGAAADFIVHDRHELRHKVIVDTPDLDSLRSEHRVVTKALLKAAHLAIYVFEPRRYNDERVWSVLRTEEQFSACAAILNKTNDRERLQSVEELQDVAADLRHLLGTIGQRDCPLFCLSADAHLASGPLSPAPPLVDQFDDFRDFLERCLEDSDIARRIRAQRERVVSHLEQQIAAALPPALTDNVERLSTAASDATGELLPRLERQLNDPLTAVDQQLADLFRWRSLDRFHGPFHYWLLSWALLGLAVRRAFQTLSMGVVPLWSSRDPERQQGWIGQILRSGGEAEVSQAFRDAAQVVQNELFSQRLPISRWRNLVADFQPGAWLDRVAQDIQRAFEVQALLGQQRKGVSGAICWTVSVIGGVVPAGLLGLGLWGMIQELYAGRYLGFDLLGHLLAVIALLFVMLQIVVSVLVPRTAERLRGLTRDALRSATDQVFIRWGEKYRADLQSDVAALREPLRIVRAALNARLTTSSRDVDRPLSLPKPKPTPVAAASAVSVPPPPATSAIRSTSAPHIERNVGAVGTSETAETRPTPPLAASPARSDPGASSPAAATLPPQPASAADQPPTSTTAQPANPPQPSAPPAAVAPPAVASASAPSSSSMTTQSILHRAESPVPAPRPRLADLPQLSAPQSADAMIPSRTAAMPATDSPVAKQEAKESATKQAATEPAQVASKKPSNDLAKELNREPTKEPSKPPTIDLAARLRAARKSG